jgi:hypothetical protein
MPECLMVTGNTPRMIRIALDSGAGDHVVGPEDVQGLTIEESAGSKAGRHFMAANKQRIPNIGQVTVTMKDQGTNGMFNSVLQIAEVSRPLYSVGRMCDAGAEVTFDAKKAIVRMNGKELARFQREGGLYIAEMMVGPRKTSAGFTRPEPKR